jgi:hypothetical protein
LSIGIIFTELACFQEIVDGVVNLTNLSVAETTVYICIELLTSFEVFDSVAVFLDGRRYFAQYSIRISNVIERWSIGLIADIYGLLKESVGLFN